MRPGPTIEPLPYLIRNSRKYLANKLLDIVSALDHNLIQLVQFPDVRMASSVCAANRKACRMWIRAVCLTRTIANLDILLCTTARLLVLPS